MKVRVGSHKLTINFNAHLHGGGRFSFRFRVKLKLLELERHLHYVIPDGKTPLNTQIAPAVLRLILIISSWSSIQFRVRDEDSKMIFYFFFII